MKKNKRVPLTRKQRVWNIFGLIVAGIGPLILLWIWMDAGEATALSKILCPSISLLVFWGFCHDWKYGRVPKTREEIERERQEDDDWVDRSYNPMFSHLPNNIFYDD